MVPLRPRVQAPDLFRITTDGGTPRRYQIARNRSGERLFRRTKIAVQPGQGELIKTWDSWHSGMGWSRDETRSGEYAAPVYESGACTATHRGFLYPPLALTGISLGAGEETVNRIAETVSPNRIYYFTTSGGDIRVHKIDPSDDSVDNQTTFVGWPAPAGQIAEFGGYLYVPSAGGVFKELTTITSDLTNDTWTDGPTDRKAWHLATAGNLLWRVGDNAATPKRHVINSCAAIGTGGAGGPLTSGNWSDTADYVIGRPGRNINSLAELGRWLQVGKEEGVFSSDADGNQSNVLDFVRNLIASTNCSDMVRWLGTLVICWRGGLWQFTGTSSRPIGIETLESNVSAVKGGRYVCLAAAGQWLYAIYLVGSDYHLLAARPGHSDEPVVVWHHLHSISHATNALHVCCTTTNPKLFLGTKAVGYAFYLTLAQDGSPDPSDANVSFHSGTFNVDLSAVDWGVPGTLKRGHMVEVVTSQAKGSGGSVQVYYGWDGATPSTALGSAITTAGRSRLFWTAGSSDFGYRLQLRLALSGGANVLRVEKVSLYCLALPRKEEVIQATLVLPGTLDSSRSRERQYSDLDALVNAGVYTLYDPDDPEGTATFKVIIDNLEPSKGEQIERLEGTEHVQVTMRVVKYS